MLTVVPLRDEIVGDRADALALLLLATIAVLAAVCGNLAQLVLARASRRSTELAMRKALGAGAWRCFDSRCPNVLASLGGAAGVALAFWLLPLLISLAPSGIPRLIDASIDARVSNASVGATLLTGVLFGVAPALRLSRLSPLQVLRRGSAGPARGRGRQSLLITLQVAVA